MQTAEINTQIKQAVSRALMAYIRVRNPDATGSLIGDKTLRADMCEATGIMGSDIDCLSQGTKMPSLAEIYCLAKGLNISADTLLGLEEESKPHIAGQTSDLLIVDDPVGQLERPVDDANPAHYRRGGLEVVDVAEAFGLDEDAYRFNILKYLLRSSFKHESPLTDMQKIVWYAERKIKRLEQVEELLDTIKDSELRDLRVRNLLTSYNADTKTLTVTWDPPLDIELGEVPVYRCEVYGPQNTLCAGTPASLRDPYRKVTTVVTTEGEYRVVVSCELDGQAAQIVHSFQLFARDLNTEDGKPRAGNTAMGTEAKEENDDEVDEE